MKIVGLTGLGGLWALKWAWQTFFLGQSTDINEKRLKRYGRGKFLKVLSSTKTVGATVLGGLWALEWAWHSAEKNLRCVRNSIA